MARELFSFRFAEILLPRFFIYVIIKNMGVLEVIKKRRSIRKFKPDPISEEVIDKLIEAIIWAPSVGNRQMRKFFFVFNNE